MKTRYLIACAVYCAVIFWLSSQPRPLGLESPVPGADKIAHLVVYAGLAVLVSVGLRRSGGPSPGVQFWVPIVFAALYGMSDEIHQIFVPSRTFSMADWAADVTGAAAAQWALCIILWRIPLRARAQT